MRNRNRHDHPTRCVDGRTMRHDPQPDDPGLETDIGKCEECGGKGCDATQRGYDPKVAPCDDAEFGLKP